MILFIIRERNDIDMCGLFFSADKERSFYADKL